MVRPRYSSITMAHFFLALAMVGCGGSEEPEQIPNESPGPVAGEPAEILLANDSTLGGIAIVVRKQDGTTVPALFRGPSKLAEVASGGDWEFHEDSLMSRVRLLGPGEEIRGQGGG